MRKKKIFLFGAGTKGKECYDFFQKQGYYEIVAFIDNDHRKIGKKFYEKDIISLDYAKTYFDIPIIITSSVYYDEIKKQLNKFKLESYLFAPNIYLSKNLLITDKDVDVNDVYSSQYHDNLYFYIKDIFANKVDLKSIDNIILDNSSDISFLINSISTLGISRFDERFTYIGGKKNLQILKREFPYIIKNGTENFFPISEALYLYSYFIMGMDISYCKMLREEIEKIDINRNILYKKDYYGQKYELWKELNFQDEFEHDICGKISCIEESNGSRYYEKFDINIGIVCDEFLYALYKDVGNVFYITPENYKKYQGKLDIFIVASVWNGINAEWNFSIDKKMEITKEILDFYRSADKNIKTVFYSKEDPIHYDYFKEFAKLFEYVFTTDINCVEQYKGDLGNQKVYNINFAINPLYHNPIGINRYNYDAVVFSGSWYEKYSNRNEKLMEIFDGVIENGKSLYIVDRQFDNSNKIHFPLKYLSFVLKKIPHDKLQKFHKMFNFAININTVQNSDTMFANRVYELQAQGNILISNYSKGIQNNFKNVHIVETKKDLDGFFEKFSDMKDVIEMQRIGIRNVMTNNTVYNRMEEMLSILDIPFSKIQPKVLIVVKNMTEGLNEQIKRQTYKYFDIINESQFNDVLILEYDYVLFMSSQYSYDEHYLQEMLNAFKYTDVEFVAKNEFEHQKNYTYINEYRSKYITMFSTKNIYEIDDINMKKIKKGFLIP